MLISCAKSQRKTRRKLKAKESVDMEEWKLIWETLPGWVMAKAWENFTKLIKATQIYHLSWRETHLQQLAEGIPAGQALDTPKGTPLHHPDACKRTIMAVRWRWASNPGLHSRHARHLASQRELRWRRQGAKAKGARRGGTFRKAPLQRVLG